MKWYFTRYHPRYVRSLIYMLQASEYNADDFLRWNLRVRNFRQVEKRGRLKFTPKATGLFVFAWSFELLILFLILVGLSAAAGDIPHMVAILFILFFQLLLPYLLAFTVRVINLAQKPVEARIIAQAKAKLATHKGFKIAIAGSYGKTSMREILRTVLSEGKKVAAPGGSENTPLAIARFIEKLHGDEDVLIFELGEYYPGDIKQLCEMVQPQLGIITGVNEAHLEKFGSLEAAAATIFELAPFVKALYVNGENDAARGRAGSATVFSREGVGDWKIVAPETSLDGTSFILEQGSIRINAQSKLLGLHSIGPLAAAAQIALSLGLTVRQIEEGIAKTRAFAHRLEKREDGGVVTLDDSYNGNPDGVRAVIDFLASLEGKRRWYVTPGLVEMGSRSEEIHRDIGAQLASVGIEKVVLIKNSVTPWIAEGLKETNYTGDIIWYDDALKCYAALPQMMVSGDVVLLQNDWPDQYA
ncbi:MAG TPA: UDP-N-acetylmuramoyl-tripeptide--D-alanyl-D-alanine ligase [Candidatus Paceibacterota bacterium]|nr:UDP-N-acetylmuramoyl-tripeptide--D-alanyl-D-alanine ligase [Candidatus Paceibacterota bacterium]